MDAIFLREAIALSRDMPAREGGGPFGAVVVRDGAVVGRGWNRVTVSNDPTAHAEVVAIRDACARLASFSLAGCEIYASCEPCPMCLAAIHWARLERITFAAGAADAAAVGFDDSVIAEQLVLPRGRRRIPAVQALRGEAVAALAAWQALPGRVPY